MEKIEKIIMEIVIVIKDDYEDVHITDNYGHSCNYGDGNYDNGLTARGVGDSVTDFLKSYYKGRIK